MNQPPPKRLANSTSPYLRQHAQNPVDWYPWGPEALERAKSEDKPILLSVGYSACHWCHVMAHESFEDPQTAALMNANFVCIKVDREERPDIDAIYQKVVALMGQGGGWPLTVFLTPDQRPFYGGTYFPPEDRYGRPSFRRVLTALAETWADKREEVERQVESFMGGLEDIAGALDEGLAGAGDAGSLIQAQTLNEAGRRLLAVFDGEHGGFGSAPKFPNVPALTLLLVLATAGEEDAEAALRLGLEKMWRGGIYDHLRGGFARYSTDERWLIPHFEKMLYDNGQLLELYARAAVAFDDLGCARRVVEESAAYLAADMRDAEGGFYSATDADSEGVEGKYFCWTPAQLEAALGAEEAARVMTLHGVPSGPTGNFEAGMSVLWRPVLSAAELGGEGGPEGRAETEAELDAALAPARAKLLALRYERVPPLRDEKILTAWNALVIAGLCAAADAAELAWEDAEAAARWDELARAAADFLLARHRDAGGRLLRASWQGRGHTRAYLEDLALLARACLALHERSLEPRWHEAAEALGIELFTHYRREGGGFHTVADDGEALLERSESQHDSPLPSGVSVAVEVLARLALGGVASSASAPVEDDELAAHLEQTLARFRGAQARPSANAGLIVAARWLGPAATHVTLRAERHDHPALRELVAELRRLRGRSPRPITWSFSAHAGAGAHALVCRAQTCSMPISEVDALREQLL
ncbi:thioredoxin domain-containing protein [Pseudenhygromyxa sp. WMMC2535]|uniref:DUF255 domain-containing protein n=1 Tax=Pseudenhygromyxa sp. WMMC2535 TaxID=2712867 RepID=UPI0015555682|nr:thioredoxin domain-containing protein [Pseudenhygromyxa sp. WMMC2535]